MAHTRASKYPIVLVVFTAASLNLFCALGESPTGRFEVDQSICDAGLIATRPVSAALHEWLRVMAEHCAINSNCGYALLRDDTTIVQRRQLQRLKIQDFM
jgi:hypothetical protein